MTMDATNDSSTINTNLEEDPELSYFTWKVQAKDGASNAATLVESTGLLTLLVNDPTWAAYPPNRSVSPGGTVHIAPRPVIPAHVPITAGMTNAQISVAKYSNDRHEVWHKAKETFKTGLIRSLGPTLAGTIGPPPNGFRNIELMDIMNAVHDRCSTVDQVALNRMEETLSSPLVNIRDLNKHLAKLNRNIMMHEAAGFPIEDYVRVRLFRKSVMHHPQIAVCLASHDDKNIDHRAHTFAQVTKYVVTHLPPILSAATQMATHGKAFSVTAGQAPGTVQELATAYHMLMTEMEKLKKQAGGKRNNNGGAKGIAKKQKGDGTKKGKADQTGPCDFYCFAHGAQNSHTSQQCKVMVNQPDNFTAAQRSATGPNSPPGRSTAVRGRAPENQ